MLSYIKRFTKWLADINGVDRDLKRRLGSTFAYSAFSGMPMSIFLTIIAAMLTEQGVDIAVITTFAACRLPYSLKVFFAPILDTIRPNIFGNNISHRKSWMILSQIGICITCLVIAQLDLDRDLTQLKWCCTIIALLSASYDVSWDAMRIEFLKTELLEKAVGVSSVGYQLGKAITGAGILWASTYLAWNTIFILLAGIFGVAVIICFVCSDYALIAHNTKINFQEVGIEVGINEQIKSKMGKLVNATKNAWLDILRRKHMSWILLSIALYKTCDAMLSSVTMNFYLKAGFSKEEIAMVIKVYVAVITLLGASFGAWLCKTLGIFRGLIICAAAEAATNCLYIFINHYPTYPVFVTNVLVENFTGGMGSCALTVYISRMVNKSFTGMQYAIFASAVSVFNISLTQYSGVILNSIGWDYYCIFTALLGLPSIGIIYYLNKKGIYPN